MKYLSNDDDIISLGLSFVKFMGEYGHSKSKILKIWRIINISILAVTLWFVVANLSHAKGVDLVKTIEGVSTTIHTLLKYLVFIYYKPKIQQLLEDKAKFWDYKSFDEKVVKKAKFTFACVKFIQYYVFVGMIWVIVLYWLRPFLENNVRFLYELHWTYPDSTILETIVLACQYYSLGASMPMILSCDYVYFSYSTHLTLQLRLLNYKFKNMSAKTKVGELYQWISYRQFLNSIFKSINSIFFWVLLFHYFVTLATCCTQLYIILLGLADSREIVALTLYNISSFIEFGYYAFPAEALVTEMRNLSNAIYNSPWYELDVKTQKMLLFLMTQSQGQRYISLGGIIEMNVDAFTSVVRKSFSFFAIIRNVLDK